MVMTMRIRSIQSILKKMAFIYVKSVKPNTNIAENLKNI